MRLKSFVVIAILAAGSMPAGCVQHHLHGEPAAPKAAPASQGETVSLQGDQSAWINSPHIHAYYDLSVASLGKSAGKLDFDLFGISEGNAMLVYRASGIDPWELAPDYTLVTGNTTNAVTCEAILSRIDKAVSV